MFHAVELDKSLPITWLATGVWKELPKPPPAVDPETIATSKIDVFRQE